MYRNPISYKPIRKGEGVKTAEKTGEDPEMRATERHMAPHHQYQGDGGNTTGANQEGLHYKYFNNWKMRFSCGFSVPVWHIQ